LITIKKCVGYASQFAAKPVGEWTAPSQKENQLRLVRAINFLPAPRREKSTYTCAKKAKYWREYGLSFVAGADDGIGGTIIIDRGAGSEARTRPDSCANEGVPHAMPRAS
jgi:hypothetical protein